MTDNKKNERNLKMAGTILSENLSVSDISKKGNDNILIIGGSGAGKSYCYIGPNIMQAVGSTRL